MGFQDLQVLASHGSAGTLPPAIVLQATATLVKLVPTSQEDL